VNPQLRPYLRFWWLGFIGLCVAAVAGAMVVYHIEPGIPPKLEERTPPSYTASERILLNNASNPIVRTAETSVTPRAPRVSGEPRDPVIETAPPGTGPLIEAANLLPVVIESDVVAKLREARVGHLRGTVSAQQLFARETPGGGLRPSAFPVIEVRASSPTALEATRLVEGTVAGFERWLVQEQEQTRVPAKQRIVIQPLDDSAKVEEVNESSFGLAAVVAGAVLAGVALLISLLHRAFPPRQSVRRWRPFARRTTPSPTPEGDVARMDGPEGAGGAEHVGVDGAESPRDRLEAWLEEPAPGDGSTGSARAPRSTAD
jgi:hypothetical protein